MALKNLVSRLTRTVEEDDRDKLRKYCENLGVAPIESIQARRKARVAGEVQALRIVPRAGSPTLEATINDGSGSLTAVFLGRRSVGGITNGRRLVVEGTVRAERGRRFVYNPVYRLLP